MQRGRGRMEAPPPSFLYADFEAMQNVEGIFFANLLCYLSAEEEDIHALEGVDCALQFLHDLDDLVDVPDSDGEREITQLERVRWHVYSSRTLPATTRGGGPTDGGGQSVVFQGLDP